jgi:uncharacterized protein YciI
MAVFVVTMVNGPQWDPAVARREQAGWPEHAEFMDRLLADGTVLLGGPVGDGTDVLVVVEAADEGQLRSTFAADPWSDRILRICRIQPWQLWLDSRPQWRTAVPTEKAATALGAPGS